MHALMGKSNKTPTPQELYRARKQKEEAERNAFLPPGLVNHGNTCFMNSVLQGLIATPMLADIVRFSLPETYAPVSSRRSPQLTNGHGLGGEWEREPEEGMPLGDTFVNLMLRAWKAQDERVRTSLRPSDLLARLGSKFDQYLDFRQQDAHEFLRHLLDAMRMEEMDIIKKRQPMPPKPKRRRKRKSTNAKNPHSSSSEAPKKNGMPEDDRLSSFVDMVFGGRLASILVCEKCKKISCTYEDFNDLSLSIKQEDYEKTRKRDRLKTLAKNLKFGMRGRGLTRESDLQEAGSESGQAPRSSSVPSSPLRRSEEAEKSFELMLGDVQQRRRSLEAGEETPSLTNPVREEGSPDDRDGSNERKTKDEGRMLGVLEEGKPLEEDDLQKEEPRREKDKDKDEDGWVKLRRKIGVGIGVKKPRKKSGQKEPLPDLPSNDDSQADVTGDEAVDSFVDVKAPSPSFVSPAVSPLLGASIALQKFSFVRRPSSSRTETASPSLSALPSPSRTPEIPTVALPPAELRPSSPSLSPTPASLPQEHHIRPKSPRPPKPSRAESVYLSRLLADVPSSSTPNNNTPFNLFRSGAQALSSSSPDILLTDMRHSVWNGAKLGLGHVQSVEGCLRMFTAVEVLDGENMVACRRCWKIQHGVYNPRRKDENDEDEDEDEDEDGADGNDDDEERDHDGGNSSSSASVKISLDCGDGSHSREPAMGSTSPLSSSLELYEDISVRSGSAPVSSPNTRSFESQDVQRAALLNTEMYSSPTLNVPSISTTAPDPILPSSEQQTPTPIAETAFERAQAPSSTKLVSSPSRDSLQLPTARFRHFRQPAERRSSVTMSMSDTSSLSSDDEAGTETETSLTASIRSDTSSAGSTRLEPSGRSKTQTLSSSSIDNDLPSDVRTSSPRTKSKSGGGGSDKTKVPRPKQVIQRRAYKRYLIATPPPVLVVHLKRFHQVGGGNGSGGRFGPTQMQFFANFKKLDDTVGFPEYLDLGPFLLPSKGKEGGVRRGKGNGRGKGRRKKERGKKEKEKEEEGRESEGDDESEVKVAGSDTEGCTYRLYAVVVHIGNMLGGHYVAYTALPEPPPYPSSPPATATSTSREDSSSSLATSTAPIETLRPEIPRTTSFTRTANPSPNVSSASKSRTSASASSSAKGLGGGGGGAQRQWCYISDTVVRLASLEEVLQAKAYICMYERI